MCYGCIDVRINIKAAFLDFISLIADNDQDLEVNGAIDHIKKGKDRLSKIGVQFGKTQIAIDDKLVVLIGQHGRALKTFDYR